MEKKQLSKEQIEEIFAGTTIHGRIAYLVYVELATFSSVTADDVVAVCAENNVAVSHAHAAIVASNMALAK